MAHGQPRILLTCLNVLLGLVVTAQGEPPALRRLERSERHMGTTFRIVVYAPDASQADEALRAAFARVAQLDQIMSNYRADSELMQLSSLTPSPQPTRVSDDLWRVLHRAQQVSRQSDGAFDVTVGPLTRLWRRTRRTHVWPSDEVLESARRAVGFDGLQLDDGTKSVRLTRPGMLLDLGGIAAGDALDQALLVLNRHGLHSVLVDASGDIRVGDPPPGESGWRVALSGLDPETVGSESLELKGCAVATSGDMWQYVERDGIRYSHILDPRTGIGLTERMNVTVIAPTGIVADAWSTTVAVMGAKAGIARIAQQDGLAARVVYLHNGAVEVSQTDNFRPMGRHTNPKRERGT
jgi:thiamine biosynthesis lipoprotein